jgi:hypothetical protein
MAKDAMQHEASLTMDDAADQDSEHERAQDADERVIGDPLLGILGECGNLAGQGVQLVGKIPEAGFGCRCGPGPGLDAVRLRGGWPLCAHGGNFAAQRFNLGAKIVIAHDRILSHAANATTYRLRKKATRAGQ